MENEGGDDWVNMHKATLFVYHGDTSAERVSVSTPSPLDAGDTAGMRKALAEIEVLDVFKVKIDDGTFFGGQDLVEWLCARLKQELAFGAAVRKELEDERQASGREFDRLSSLEKELKKRVEDQAAELGTVERRLADTTEALRSQKNLRMKEMLQNQGSAKEISDLESEVSGLMERINLQADVAAAVEKECEALRSTVRKGRHAREAEDASFRTTLAEKMKSEDILLRVKRRLHAAEVENREKDDRMTRLQREADRLRATLWSHGINPVSNASGSTGRNNSVVEKPGNSLGKGAIARRGPNPQHGRRRDNKRPHDPPRLKKLAPLSHINGGTGGSSAFGNSSSKVSAAVIGFRNRVGDGDIKPREWRHQ